MIEFFNTGFGFGVLAAGWTIGFVITVSAISGAITILFGVYGFIKLIWLTRKK